MVGKEYKYQGAASAVFRRHEPVIGQLWLWRPAKVEVPVETFE